MRAKNNIYHMDCFSCVSCGRQLVPGDEFALRDDGLLCRADHEALERRVNAGNYDYIGGAGPTHDVSTGGGGHEDSRTETNNNEDSKIGQYACMLYLKHVRPSCVYLSVCLDVSVCDSVCLYVSVCIYLSVCPSVSLYVCVSAVCVAVCLSWCVYMPVSDGVFWSFGIVVV